MQLRVEAVIAHGTYPDGDSVTFCLKLCLQPEPTTYRQPTVDTAFTTSDAEQSPYQALLTYWTDGAYLFRSTHSWITRLMYAREPLRFLRGHLMACRLPTPVTREGSIYQLVRQVHTPTSCIGEASTSTCGLPTIFT